MCNLLNLYLLSRTPTFSPLKERRKKILKGHEEPLDSSWLSKEPTIETVRKKAQNVQIHEMFMSAYEKLNPFRGNGLSCSPTVLPKDAMFSGTNLAQQKRRLQKNSLYKCVTLCVSWCKTHLLSKAELNCTPSGPRSTTLTKIWSRSITWLFSRLTGNSLIKQQQAWN